jgi:hypothetical protein
MQRLFLSIMLLAAANAFALPFLEVDELREGKYLGWPEPVKLSEDGAAAHEGVSLNGKLIPHMMTSS